MASNPPTPIFVFEPDVYPPSSPLPISLTNVHSPSRIPTIKLPTLPFANGVNTHPTEMGSLPFAPPPRIVMSASPGITSSSAITSSSGITSSSAITSSSGITGSPGIPQITLPNLNSLSRTTATPSISQIGHPPIIPSTFQRHPTGAAVTIGSSTNAPGSPSLYGSPVVGPKSPSWYNTYATPVAGPSSPLPSTSYTTVVAGPSSPSLHGYGSFVLPSLRSPVPTERPVNTPLVSARSPVMTSMKSPLLSVLSPKPKAMRDNMSLFNPVPLTPNSVSAMLGDYHNQWLPEVDQQQPIRGVVNVNTTFQQLQTIANGYHPVAIPTEQEGSAALGGVSSIQFPVGHRKEEGSSVAAHMRSLMNVTNSFANCYHTTYKNLLPFKGHVDQQQFNEALAVYESNQVYYQECIDNQSLTTEEITVGLVELERWFAAIMEPLSNDNAVDHRKFLQDKGVTAHCDPELYPYLKVLLHV